MNKDERLFMLNKRGCLKKCMADFGAHLDGWVHLLEGIKSPVGTDCLRIEYPY